MPQDFTRIAQAAALGLVITAITQVTYFALSSNGMEPDRPLIWGLEVLAFTGIAIAGFALLPARPLVGAAIGTFGVLNTVQVGVGLTMFTPLMEGGEALGPVFGAVLAMAFLLYFAAKIAIGTAALALAQPLLASSGTAKAVGALAGLSGLAAIVLNTLGIMAGRDWTVAAGAAGTVAALLVALALLMKKPASQA